MPLLEKISSWLGTLWPACLPCKGRRGLPSVGLCCLAPQNGTAVPLKPGQEQGRGGREDASKIFLLKIFWSRRRSFFFFFFFFSPTLSGKPKSY